MNGERVGITADRRAAEQAALVRALGGVPVIGPALRADTPARDRDVLREVDAALSAPLDDAVFLTGVGGELLLACADAHGRGPRLRRALERARVLARGPKPRRALRAAGVRIDVVVEPPRAPAAVAAVRGAPLPGRRVMVQGFGPPPEEIAAPLRAAGAEIVVVSPYAAGWPADPGPAQELARDARDGRLAAMTFTSALAARQLAVLAESAGVEAADIAASGCLLAAVGAVTRRALEAEGLPVHVEADPPRMGALYRALDAALAARRAPGRARAAVP